MRQRERQKSNRFNKQTRFARAAHAFVLFVAVTARLQYDVKFPYTKNSRRLRPRSATPMRFRLKKNTGNPGSVIVPQHGSSKITVSVWGKNTILKFLGNTK